MHAEYGEKGACHIIIYFHNNETFPFCLGKVSTVCAFCVEKLGF